MLCEACKERTATIHLTEVSNGQRSETHLCQQCARQKGLVISSQVPFNELLNTLLSTQADKTTGDSEGKSAPGSDRACPVCGMTLRRFAKEPLLGCPHDYVAFEEPLRKLIERTQEGASAHVGRVPKHTGGRHFQRLTLIRLRQELQQAIDQEDYEAAVQLRDEISKCESS